MVNRFAAILLICFVTTLVLIGCNPSRNAARERLNLLTKTLIAGDWKDLGPFIASGESEGWAMNPSELARFLQSYANCEPRHISLRLVLPGNVPASLKDSASKVTVYVQAEGDGVSPVVVSLVARHAGDGVWLIRERELANGFLGILHPDFDERYRCMRKALIENHLNKFGWHGHYTTPERIQAYLDRKIGNDRLFSSDPDHNPVLATPTSGQ